MKVYKPYPAMTGLTDYVDISYLKSQNAVSAAGLVGGGVVLLAAYNLPASKGLLKFSTYALGMLCLAYNMGQLKYGGNA